MRISVYGHTEMGPRHEANEDVILIGRTVCRSGDVTAEVNKGDWGAFETGLLVAVADGMGIDAVGAAAARLTLKTLKASYYKEAQGADLRTLTNVLYNVAQNVNTVVLEYGNQQPEYVGMACTLSGVLLLRGEYVVFNAGDSRVYRHSHGILRQVTDDDSLVAEAVRRGEMTLAEAKESTERHFVTNAMGSQDFQLYLGECQSLQAGDALLLCSDGLHNVMDLDEMEQFFAKYGSAEERCKEIMKVAVASGDYDDISVIVVNAEASDN
jgi:PPM family protein phosphatase